MDSISGIHGFDTHRILQQSSETTPALKDLGNQFAQLLAQPPGNAHVPSVGESTALTKIVGSHEKLYADLTRDLARTPSEMTTMNTDQMRVKTVEMMFRVVGVHMQHSAVTFIAQSSKNGLQTLMKNQ